MASTLSTLETALRKKLAPRINGREFELPPPRLDPGARSQRRLSWRNERYLYNRTCSLTGEPMVSAFSPDKPFKVYAHDAWWSDAWDPFQYGREFDFSRPFFAQFAELLHEVPRLSLVNTSSENSQYNNWVIYLKNCYLVTGARADEDCYYSHWLWRSKNCVDCSHVYDSELCYECIDCTKCYNLRYSQDCLQCSESAFLADCVGCTDCLCCAGLRQKRFCIGNVQLPEAEYKQRLSNLLPFDSLQLADLAAELSRLVPAGGESPLRNRLAEDCSGNYLEECKGCHACYDCQGCQDCLSCDSAMRSTDLLACSRSAHSELCSECVSAVNSSRALFSVMAWYCHDVLYCDSCFHSQNLFGSTGLRNQDYCILNVKYSPAQYTQLMSRIINHLRETGEWGEFFPAAYSFFGYNESIAADPFPLTRDEALALGYRWSDYVRPVPPAADKEGTRVCAATGRPFRLMAQELAFYERQQLAAPRYHPDERHRRREEKRAPLAPALGSPDDQGTAGCLRRK